MNLVSMSPNRQILEENGIFYIKHSTDIITLDLSKINVSDLLSIASYLLQQINDLTGPTISHTNVFMENKTKQGTILDPNDI